MAKIQLAVHQMSNVLKNGNDLDASVVLKEAAREAGKFNAVKSNSGSFIPCRFNKNGTIKKGFIERYKNFKKAEMSMGYFVFEFVHVKGTSF